MFWFEKQFKKTKKKQYRCFEFKFYICPPQLLLTISNFQNKKMIFWHFVCFPFDLLLTLTKNRLNVFKKKLFCPTSKNGDSLGGMFFGLFSMKFLRNLLKKISKAFPRPERTVWLNISWSNVIYGHHSYFKK